MGLGQAEKRPDAKQFIDFMQSAEQLEQENERLRAELKARDERDAEIDRKLEIYEKYKDVLENTPYAFYQLTLRNQEAIRLFFMQVHRDLGITVDDTEAEKKVKVKEGAVRVDALINYLFNWVVSNPVRWATMLREFKGISGQ